MPTLGEASIKFSVAGVEQVKAALDAVQKQLQAIQQGVATVGPIITNVLAAARTQLEGFVRAGIASSNAGVVFGFQMQRIARELASLFLPAIKLALDYLRQFADWLSRLSGAQQQNIARWIAAAATMLAVVLIVPKVIAGIGALAVGLRTLTLAVIGLESSTGLGALLPILGGVAAAIAALAIGSEVGRQGLGGLWAAIKPLVDGFGKLFTQLWQSAEPMMGQLAGLFEMVQASAMRLMPAFQGMARSMGDVLGTVGTMVVRVLGQALGFFLRLAESLAPLVAATVKWGAALAHVLAPAIEFATQLQYAFLEAMTSWLGPLGEVVSAMVDALAPALQEIGDALGEALLPIMGLVNDLMGSFREVIVAVMPFVVLLAKIIANQLVVALQALAGALRIVAQTLAFVTGKKYKLDLDARPPKPFEEKDHERLEAKSRGFEAVEQTWQRIAEASVTATLGRSIPEEQRDLLRDIAANTGGITPAIQGIKPGVVP